MSATRKGRELPELTPQAALDMLASAINYCQSAGLTVRAANTTGGLLAILIVGCRVDGDRFEVISADMPALTPGSSPVVYEERSE